MGEWSAKWSDSTCWSYSRLMCTGLWWREGPRGHCPVTRPSSNLQARLCFDRLNCLFSCAKHHRHPRLTAWSIKRTVCTLRDWRDRPPGTNVVLPKIGWFTFFIVFQVPPLAMCLYTQEDHKIITCRFLERHFDSSPLKNTLEIIEHTSSMCCSYFASSCCSYPLPVSQQEPSVRCSEEG